jgi:hypothetical protein
MEPSIASACRDVLDRLRAQVNGHLPALSQTYRAGNSVSESLVPLDRLPMIGQVVQQYIESEAIYASAFQQSDNNGQPNNSE